VDALFTSQQEYLFSPFVKTFVYWAGIAEPPQREVFKEAGKSAGGRPKDQSVSAGAVGRTTNSVRDSQSHDRDGNGDGPAAVFGYGVVSVTE